ncbi:MAG: NACHT domain-containing protein [Anaerolineaceae bacterium]|nr:NACHT domain-containing protein [Anaerolineaceae bacterium]
MAPLQLTFFGGFNVASSGKALAFSRRKVMALLVFLALEAGQAHSRESLMGLLWPDLPEADARNNLRVSLARLRQRLAPAQTAVPSLITSRAEVRWQIDNAGSVSLDSAAFQTLLAQTDDHSHASRQACPDCQQKLAAAVDIYRGPLLHGFYLDDCPAFEEWLFVWRERLHLQTMEALDELAQGLLENGRLDKATTYTRRQLELDPLHDSAQRRLLHLLAYQGQTAAALSQFQSYKTVLREELGIDPDVALLELVRQIKAGTLPAPGTREAEQAKSAVRHNLPENLTPFLGRETELAQLAARLATPAYRLVTLVGPGGIGKTRLALEVARANLHQYPDGAFFVSLNGVTAASEIPNAIAEAMQLPFSGEGSPASEILRLLQHKQLLLVIDNLEHIMEAGTALLLKILQAAPRVVLLVTSRERLNVQAEDLFRLKGLPYPTEPEDTTAGQFPAVRLFGDRAHRLNKQVLLNDETLPHVVRICQLVEGLPLGLELAATWVRDFTVAQIADAIAQDIALLQTDLKDVDPRHQSIEGVFEYSWRLLSAEEQRLLPLLSLFRGGFTAEAATQVMQASPVVIRRLRYKSLLQHEGNGRYTIHELVRQLAEKHLRHTPEIIPAARQAYAAYYLGLVIEKSPLLNGPEAAQTAVGLRQELDNIREAWQTAVHQLDLPLIAQTAEPIVEFFVHIGLNYEIEKRISDALVALKTGGAESSEQLLMLLELLILDLKRYYERPDLFEASFEPIMDRLQNWENPLALPYRARAVFYHSHALAEGGHAEKAVAQCELALALAYQINQPIHLGFVLCQRAFYHYKERQLQKALDALNSAALLFEQEGHLKGMSRVEDKLAPSYAENGNYWQALVHDKKALALYQQLGDERMIPRGHQGVGLSSVILGDYQQARYHFNQAIKLSQKISHESGVKGGLGGLAEVEFLEGNLEEAKRLYQICIARRLEDKEYARFCFEGSDMVRMLWRSREYEEAAALNEEILGWVHKFGNQTDIQMAQATQALILWELGQHEQAVDILETIWPNIDPYSLAEPVKTLSDIYSVFDRANHPQTKAVINVAYQVVSKLADDIPDPALQAMFLQNVPYCRWLAAGFKKHQLLETP